MDLWSAARNLFAGSRPYPPSLLLALCLGAAVLLPSSSTASVPAEGENEPLAAFSPVRASYSPALSVATLSSGSLMASLSFSPSSAGRLTIRSARHTAPLLRDASAYLFLRDGSEIDLATDGWPLGEVSLRAVAEPGLGSGIRAEAETWLPRLDMIVREEVTLFDDGPYFTFRLVLPRQDDSIAGFAYLGGTLLPGERPERVTYLGDDDRVVQGTVPGERISVSLGPGKPILLQGSEGQPGLLMAMLDPSDASSTLTASRSAGGVSFRWEQAHLANGGHGEVELPRLLVRTADGTSIREMFEPYRDLMATLYPPPPLPAWFRQQWISWYLYGMDIDEAKLRSQIDYIAANLADIGPWSILIDAGWYVAEGRPGADWRAIDRDKFPSGLKPLVDYAHSRGIKVVLYFSASYVDDREAPGNWLGLRGIVDEHPDWLVPIQSGDPWRAYYYDFSKPGFQDYMREVLRDYFVSYGVDGIKVDGLMDTRLAVLRGIDRGLYTPFSSPTFPTTSVYAFIFQEASAIKPDVYLEAGWSMPAFSTPHFTLARQSDDRPDFESGYPEPGLAGHVDYAIAQLVLLGQRPHLGNYWGDPNSNPIGLQWLEAGLALNAPVVLGFDLNELSLEALSEYRGRLAALRPFRGEVHLPESLEPNSFSATTDGTTFLALLNRERSGREMRASLADHGLPADRRLAAYDVAAGQPLPMRGLVAAAVSPETLRLFAIRSEPGVLWTNSGFEVASQPYGLSLRMRGPVALPGYAFVACPLPTAVLIDGEPAAEGAWSYDDESGVLRLDYSHGEGEGTLLEIVFRDAS